MDEFEPGKTKSAHDWCMEGDAHRENENYSLAIASYSRAIGLAANNTRLLTLLLESRARLFEKMDDHDSAIRDYSKAIALKPENEAWLLHHRADCFAKKGDYDSAIRDCSKSIELEPINYAFWSARAGHFKNKGDYDSAMQNFSKAVELRPDLASAWVFRAILFAEKGDYASAIRDCSKALEVKPDDLFSLGFRASYFRLKGDYDAAARDYSKALELNPQDVLAKKGLQELTERDAMNRGQQAHMTEKGEEAEELVPRVEQTVIERKRLEERDERLITLQVVAELIKSHAPLSAEDFDESINELIKKHFPKGIEKNEADIERINLEVKKELLEFRHKKYEGNVEREIAQQIASAVLGKIESNFREHKYKNEDVKTLFKDILDGIEQELGQRNLSVSNENTIQILSKIIEEWSINPQRADVSKGLIVSAAGNETRPISTALVKDLAVDEFFEKIKQIKEASPTSPSNQFQIAERVEVDLNFSLINVDLKLSTSELLQTLYDLFKRWVLRSKQP